MKALVYVNQRELEYKDVKDPVMKENDVLIKIESVGICGSDVHAFLGHDHSDCASILT